MPTSPDTVYSFSRLYPLFGHMRELPFGLKGASNTTYPEYAAGVLLGEIAASKSTLAPYNPGATDGTQNPMAINVWPVSTDASNNIFRPGDFQGTPTQPFQTVKSIDVALGGEFNLLDIIGLDANALGIMQGVIREGVVGTNEVDTVALSSAADTFDLAITGADAVLHTFLAIAGTITAANLQILLQATLGIGSVTVALAGTTYTFKFGGAWGNQLVTLASTPHTITSTDTQVTAGAKAAVASGTRGVLSLLK